MIIINILVTQSEAQYLCYVISHSEKKKKFSFKEIVQYEAGSVIRNNISLCKWHKINIPICYTSIHMDFWSTLVSFPPKLFKTTPS